MIYLCFSYPAKDLLSGCSMSAANSYNESALRLILALWCDQESAGS
jgi:hypothetical protein